METEEVVYDVANIEELEHFDIGEDGYSDPEEVAADDISIWNSNEPKVPLSRQKRGRKKAEKIGRKMGAPIIPISRTQPRRSTREKLFQQYNTYSEGDVEAEVEREQEQEEEIEEEDCDVDLIIDPTECPEESSSKTWRVFVRKDGSGMHFDWPIYTDTPITLTNIVSIISTNASLISERMICDSIPQEYTNTGTFVVKLEEHFQKEDLCDDGLGSWHAAQMFVRKYIIGDKSKRPLMTQKNDHSLKIVCEQFIHPGTDSRGDFIRKIYTGFDNAEHMIPFVVISYEWIGQPHPLTVYEGDPKSFEQNTWKRCANSEVQVPILVKHGCEFDTAISILLSTEKFTAYGKSVPLYVQECISFVLDVNECGGDRALHSDGNEWGKPSGGSKKFKINFENEKDSKSWRIEKTNGYFDIQVTCRRYAGKQFTSSAGFIRKIFLLKIGPNCPRFITDQLVNKHLALISYTWKDSSVPTFIERENGVNNMIEAGEEVVMLSNQVINDEVIEEEGEEVEEEEEEEEEEGITEEMREMLKELKTKKDENSRRLIELTERAQRIAKIAENGEDYEGMQTIQWVRNIINMLRAEI